MYDFFYLEHFNFKYLDLTHFFLVCSGWALRNSIVLNLFDTPPHQLCGKLLNFKMYLIEFLYYQDCYLQALSVN